MENSKFRFVTMSENLEIFVLGQVPNLISGQWSVSSTDMVRLGYSEITDLCIVQKVHGVKSLGRHVTRDLSLVLLQLLRSEKLKFM